MKYQKLKAHLMSEAELREIWRKEYCVEEIVTFDTVKVRFFEDMFDHAFFESAHRMKKDKTILSYNRLEKMLWIKDTLKDPSAILKKGWNKDRKGYYTDRRVAVIKGNYIVIIRFTGMLKAKFVTAYEKNDISNILSSPEFERSERFFGDCGWA